MKLIYVMDPMCSWCWGFRAQFEALNQRLSQRVSAEIPIQHVMGGLAPDSDEPMTEKTRQYVQSQWQAVAEKTDAEFNWDFWEQCQPRRSTYPACRAVIAAGLQSSTAITDMILAIQQAYYLQARNPSDDAVLTALASEIGLDAGRFSADLNNTATNKQLQSNILRANELGVRSFPTVLLQSSAGMQVLTTGGTCVESMLNSVLTTTTNS